MKLIIKQQRGKIIKIEVDQNISVEELKSTLETIKGIPVERQILIFDSMRLHNGNNLKNYEIKSGSIITMIDKDRSLLLRASNFLNGSTLIDRIHQSTIDLQNNPQEKEVISLLSEAISYLDEQLDFTTTDEIFSLILICFSLYTEQSLKIFRIRFEKSTISELHFIVLSSILSNIKFYMPQISIDNYNDFINGSFKQISAQFSKKNFNIQSDTPLKIFDFEIPKEYKKIFFENIILLVNLTKEIVEKSFPTFFSKPINHSKLSFFIQKVSTIKLIQIIPESVFMKDDLYLDLTMGSIAILIEAMSEQSFKKSISKIEQFIQGQPITSDFANSFIKKCSKHNIKSNAMLALIHSYTDFSSIPILEYFDKNKITLDNQVINKLKGYVNAASELSKTPVLDNYPKSPILLKITQNPSILHPQYISYALLNGKDISFYETVLQSRSINCRALSTTEFWSHVLSLIPAAKKEEITDSLIYNMAHYFNTNVQSLQVNNIFDSLIFDHFPPTEAQSSFLVSLFNRLSQNYVKTYFNVNHVNSMVKTLLQQTVIPPPSCCKLFDLNSFLKMKTITPVLLYEYVFSNKRNTNSNGLNKIEIMPFSNQPSDQLIKFIQQENNFDLISNIDMESLSLIACSLYFTSNCIVPTIVNLNESNILPFYAISLNFVEQCNESLNKSTNEMIQLFNKAVMKFGTNPSPLSIASINSILSKMNILLCPELFPSKMTHFLFDYMISFLLNGKFKGDEPLLILDIFKYSCEDEPSVLFHKYGTPLFDYIIHNLTKFITKTEQFDGYLLNLALFDSNQMSKIITKLIQDASVYEEMFNVVLFLRRFCKCSPTIKFTDLTKIKAAVKYAAENEKWEDVLVLFRFMESNEIPIYSEPIKGKQIPFRICKQLFNITKQIDASDLINHILSDSKLEEDPYLFNIIFQLLMKNQNTAFKYFSLILEKMTFQQTIVPYSFNMLSSDLYKRNKELFLYTLNHCYVLYPDITALVRRINIEPIDFPEPNLDFFEKLIETKSYQSFLCLQNIASSFPFFFEPDISIADDDSLLVVDLVLPALSCVSKLFDDQINEEFINDFKAAFSAIYFLYSCLLSTRIISIFVPWIFENFASLNESQIYCMSHIIVSLFRTSEITHIVFAYALKYNFIDQITACFKKNIPNGLFKDDFYCMLYRLLLCYYNAFPRIRNAGHITFIEKICDGSFNNPFECEVNNFLSLSHLSLEPLYFDFPCNNEVRVKVYNFIRLITQPKPYWLSAQPRNHCDQSDLDEIITSIYSQQQESLLKSNIEASSMPRKITVEMYSYLMTESKLAQDLVQRKSIRFFTPLKEHHDYICQIVNNINQISRASTQKSIPYNTQVNSYEYFISVINDEQLFKELIMKAALLPSVDIKFIELIRMITTNKKTAICFQKYISEFLRQDIEFMLSSPLILPRICLLISEILKSNKIFEVNFFETCGNRLIEFAASTNFQRNQDFIMNLSDVLISIKNEKLPISVTYIIGDIFSYHPQLASKGLIMYSMINDRGEKPLNILPIIENRFKLEIEVDRPNLDIIKQYFNYVQPLKTSNMSVAINLLNKTIERYKTDRHHDESSLSFIIDLINCLAPKYELFEQAHYSSEKFETDTKPPKLDENSRNYLNPPSPLLMSTSPTFWKDVYEKNRMFLNNLFDRDNNVLYRFTFMQEYNELLAFHLRYLFFKRKMRNSINERDRFTLKVSHSDVFMSSYKEWIKRKPKDFVSRFCIQFIGEAGSDAGGLTRDWFTCITREMFSEKLGLFVKNEHNNYHPNTKVKITSDNIEKYRFAGAIVAIALARGQNINAHLSVAIRKELLHQRIEFEDLNDFDSSLYNNLLNIKNIEDVECLDLYFSIDEYENGKITSINFIKNGDQIPVTNENKIDYINFYSEYKIRETVVRQLTSFRDGFESIINYQDIKAFTPQELDLLICGSDKIDIDEMKKYTSFNGRYNLKNNTIKIFFNMISKWNQDDLTKLIYFVTGSSQLGVNGFKELYDDGNPFTINYGGNKDRLPVAHTCSRTLDLPQYDNEKDMNEKLRTAIAETHFNIC